MSNQFFPFGLAPGSNPAQSFPYDVIINEENPGLVLDPTEPNGVYVAFREVAGCSWWVLNADYNTDAAQWEQQSPTNAALPAYALEQCADGTVKRYTAIATNTPGNPVSWVLVWTLDSKGNMTLEPQAGTTTGQIASVIDVTWNAGSPAVMNVREINLTDTSSNAGSFVDNINVNNTPVWQIRKDGTLTAGIIPFARITGFVIPSGTTINNGVFTGTSTFSGPAVFNNTVTANDGLTVAGGIGVDDINVTGNEHVGGNFQVDGTSTLNNLTATGTVSLPAATFPVDSIVGTNGVSVTNSGNAYTVDGTSLVETIESTDGTVTVGRSGQTIDLTAGSTVPIVYGASFVVAQNYPITATTGTLTFPSALPGGAGVSYTIIVHGSLQFQDASHTLTLTGSGSGVTWPNSPQSYQNSQAGSFPFTSYGTCSGGDNPFVTWTCDDQLGFTPMTMVMVAYVNP